MQTIRALLKLARLDTSLLLSLTVFVPSISRTRDLELSFRRTVPLLFISICTFIANDLDDIEKDQINHPERPLPTGQLKTSLAAGAYFVSLAAALFTTRSLEVTNAAFWYYLLLTSSISYGYVVDWFPGFKALYVAAAVSIPILIVATFYPRETRLYLFAICVFLLCLGRELCQDLLNRIGDPHSFMHLIRPKPIAAMAFVSQAIAIVLLLTEARNLFAFLVVGLMAGVLLICGRYWFTLCKHSKAIALMKLNLAIGIYFLV